MPDDPPYPPAAVDGEMRGHADEMEILPGMTIVVDGEAFLVEDVEKTGPGRRELLLRPDDGGGDDG